jgi:hypothetical protein
MIMYAAERCADVAQQPANNAINNIIVSWKIMPKNN